MDYETANEIMSYEEYKNRLLQWYGSIIPKDTYIKEYKDGRELLYFGGSCQDVDLRKSYEEYKEGAKHLFECVKKWTKKHENSNG